MIAAYDLSARGVYRYWRRNTTVFRRTFILSVTAWFIEPVVYLLGMGVGLGKYLERVQAIEYIDFIAPGLLALATLYGATFETSWSAFFKMTQSRLYDAVAATPVSFEDVAIGEIFWGATRGALYGSAFAAVALPFGVFHSWWALAMLPVVPLAAVMFGALGASYTYLVREVDYLAFFWTLFVTPMLMFSGVFFPLERLPEWLQGLAWFMPLHHATEAFRDLAVRGDPGTALGHVVWMAVLAAIFLPIPPLLLRRRLSR